MAHQVVVDASCRARFYVGLRHKLINHADVVVKYKKLRFTGCRKGAQYTASDVAMHLVGCPRCAPGGTARGGTAGRAIALDSLAE